MPQEADSLPPPTVRLVVQRMFLIRRLHGKRGDMDSPAGV